MTLLFCDSFQHYPTAQIAEKWSGVTGPGVAIAAPIPPQGPSMGFFSQFSAAYKFLDITTTWILGVRVRLSAVGFGSVLCVYDSFGGGPQVTLTGLFGGALGFRRGGATGPVLATIPLFWPTGSWEYVEIAIVFNDTLGSIEVRLNGTPLLSASGLDTIPTGLPFADTLLLNGDTLAFPSHGLGASWNAGDLVILSGDSPPNDTFLGPVRVQCLNPTGQGEEEGWTPHGAPSNWQAVNGSVPGDWASYVSATGDEEADLYRVPSPSTAAVYALQTCIRRRVQESPTSRYVQELIRSGGNDYDGTVYGGTESFYGCTPHDTDPDTGLPWTSAGVGSAQFGMTAH